MIIETAQRKLKSRVLSLLRHHLQKVMYDINCELNSKVKT